ncbi:MAG: hypothetical protein C0519_15950 [Hyphomicrobium sp.]|nr:hypothetical protein [Hyphomicrobium sp.]PPD05819.1 MAG: hypothetical protein CTY28_16020 [Hyphomicrobium sp.]
MNEDNSIINRLRWRATIKLMKWAVMVAPGGSAAVALHEHHLMWIDECRHQWNLRYGAGNQGGCDVQNL